MIVLAVTLAAAGLVFGLVFDLVNWRRFGDDVAPLQGAGEVPAWAPQQAMPPQQTMPPQQAWAPQQPPTAQQAWAPQQTAPPQQVPFHPAASPTIAPAPVAPPAPAPAYRPPAPVPPPPAMAPPSAPAPPAHAPPIAPPSPPSVAQQQAYVAQQQAAHLAQQQAFAARQPPPAPAPRPAATPVGPPLLVCTGVHVAYDKVRVLFGVDMAIGQGEIVALLGTNGAGKSTLLKAVSGLVEPFEGTIVFDGRDITHVSAVERAKMGIVQVPGGKAVFPTLTVAEHFKAAGWLYAREDEAEVHARTERVLELFPRLRERWHQMAGNLSGGEQQQLGLGMAFVAKPRLLIIDELSLGLAPSVVEQLLGIVRAIHAEGCTVILVEQSVNVALTIAQRAYFMEKGEVRFQGPAAELLARGDVLRSVFLEGAAGHGAPSGAPPTTGPAVAARPGTAGNGVPDHLAGRPVALRVTGLTKRFGGITAVEDVTFDLRQGETLGLIGPNGAGKTTILDLISGVLPVDGGRIQLGGVEISEWSASRRAGAGLGRSFQDARIFPSLTVTENIALGLERHIANRDHLAAALDLPAMQASERAVAARVEELIGLMRLGAFRDKFVSELSTGVRRIVDLAMVIAHRPTVLLLDEPSSGIAQRETEALGPMLKNIQRATNCSVLIIEHDMPLISAVSDEVIALDLGTMVVRGSPAAVLSDPRVVSSYLGGDMDVVHRSGTRVPEPR